MKYRVWDNENKSYNDPYSYAYYALTQDGGLDFYCHGDHMDEADPDVYFIEQYTGVKDKNGEEIYEGDIVRINGWWDAEGPAGYDKNLCVVEWDEEKTGFVPFNNYDCDCGVYHHAEDCEVIGNIHKNPELVKEKE